MSSIIVDVVAIDAVKPHPNADRLFLAQIKGWQTVINKRDDGSPQFQVGEKVVYIPPDSTVPRPLAERLNVVNYLSEKTDIDGARVLVVKRVRLRGEPSYGFTIRPDNPDWPIGADVKEFYGIGKYMPPIKFQAGDSEAEHPLFHKYTDIENLRNYPAVLMPGEEIVVTEKIHGTSSRIGYVEENLVAGSHGLQRKRPEPEALTGNLYWFPSTLPPVMNLLDELKSRYRAVILYGEIYGSKVQSLNYGKKGVLGYAAFDLSLEGKYVDYAEFKSLCERHAVAMVPELGHGPYSLEFVKTLSRGPTTLPDTHIREGVVVRPIRERIDAKIGRVTLKYLNDDYLLNEKLAKADATDR